MTKLSPQKRKRLVKELEWEMHNSAHWPPVRRIADIVDSVLSEGEEGCNTLAFVHHFKENSSECDCGVSKRTIPLNLCSRGVLGNDHIADASKMVQEPEKELPPLPPQFNSLRGEEPCKKCEHYCNIEGWSGKCNSGENCPCSCHMKPEVSEKELDDALEEIEEPIIPALDLEWCKRPSCPLKHEHMHEKELPPLPDPIPTNFRAYGDTVAQSLTIPEMSLATKINEIIQYLAARHTGV